jgi:hypothetical protein
MHNCCPSLDTVPARLALDTLLLSSSDITSEYPVHRAGRHACAAGSLQMLLLATAGLTLVCASSAKTVQNFPSFAWVDSTRIV